jgi:hypothetical protein
MTKITFILSLLAFINSAFAMDSVLKNIILKSARAGDTSTITLHRVKDDVDELRLNHKKDAVAFIRQNRVEVNSLTPGKEHIS